MNLLKSPLADRYLSWLFPALLLASAFVYAWSVVGRLGSYPFVWVVLVIPVVVYLWVRVTWAGFGRSCRCIFWRRPSGRSMCV